MYGKGKCAHTQTRSYAAHTSTAVHIVDSRVRTAQANYCIPYTRDPTGPEKFIFHIADRDLVRCGRGSDVKSVGF